ncbi:MAG: S1 RNA-binding domain-containing protein [Patescibacteria group bacterium]
MTNTKNSYLNTLLKSESRVILVLKPGDLVEGVFLRRKAKAVYFDLGAFGTGIVYGAELMNAKEILNKLNPGDKVAAKIIDAENEDGYAELSLAEAGKQKTWQQIKELAESGEIITLKATGANSGGLTVDFVDVRGFVPVSQLSSEHYPKVDDGDRNKIIEELKKLIGQELKLKVLDVNARTNKLIFSEREVVSEANMKELLSKYKVGDLIDGIISGVASFGAFMRFADNPKIEGLIHVSELAHKIVENPKEIVKVDEAVKAKIVDIKEGRVSLSLKALQADPWVDADKKILSGQDISGDVIKFYPFGAFINLEGGLQGMVHVSEFGGVDEMKKQLEVGKSYTFKVDSVKAAEKRIVLKVKK